jgi:acylphosphatase
MKKAVSIRVYGKVQNVGFRFYTVKAAIQFDINGYVKNEPDGSVYIEAEGEPADLDTFRDWCRQGPQWSRVDRMEVQEIPVAGYKDFRVR